MKKKLQTTRFSSKQTTRRARARRSSSGSAKVRCNEGRAAQFDGHGGILRSDATSPGDATQPVVTNQIFCHA